MLQPLQFTFLCVLVSLSYPLSAQNTSHQHHDFSNHFEKRNVTGSVTLYHLESDTWVYSDSSNSQTASLPASTFKVVNALIALETRAVKDEHEIVSWPGYQDSSKYGIRPDIQHDMDLTEAVQRSAVWVFLEVAQRVGKEYYPDYLNSIPYGNGDISQPGLDFWNIGNFAVSPIEQINLLVDLHRNKLPFKKRHQKTVKEILINQEFTSYTLRAKTGWEQNDGMNTGWWIGYIEQDNNTWFFATRIQRSRTKKSSGFARSRKDITLDVLRDLKVID